jgi:hypothetical protein
MNKELMENQLLIEELRKQHLQAVPKPSYVVSGDNIENYRLQFEEMERELNEKNEIIRDLKNKVHHHATEYVKEAPKILRVPDAPIKEIHYEKDPYILEQNSKLVKELEEAIRQEQNAKLELQ